jgi:hypothetical protein
MKGMTMNLTKESVGTWMQRLKLAWENEDVDGALVLFEKTERYFERPFKPGRTQAEFRTYWQDIVSLSDVKLEYKVIAIDGDTAVVHWENWFRVKGEPDLNHLDGVFFLRFDDAHYCREFRQWWFQEPN